MTSSGDDMYKAILKEIGAEESNMDYLFDESDDEDIRDYDREGDENDLVGYGTRGAVVQALNVATESKSSMSEGEDLLHILGSKVDDSVIEDEGKFVESITANQEHANIPTQSSTGDDTDVKQQPAWKKMLEAANAKHEELMGQMINLQMAQKDSSPRNKVRRPVNHSKKDPNAEASKISSSSSIVLREINGNDFNLNSSTVSSSTLQHLSTRNLKLQDQWYSQQEKSAKLQDKLVTMQTNFYSQQEQWEKEQRELFSPARSETKIPKWHSTTLATNSTANETPTSSDKMRDEIDSTSSKNSISSLDNESCQELEASKVIIAKLKAQLKESRKIQQSQKDEIRDYKDRLTRRDLEHQALILQYETEKTSWSDEMKAKEVQYKKELQSREAELEDTRQKLLHQIAANQDVREEHMVKLEQITSDTAALKDGLESTRNLMNLKTEGVYEEGEFQLRIQELEGRHAKELEYWKAEVDDHRRQIELNSTRMESQLDVAHARYAELERKHDKEVKEWQLLLDADFTKTVEDKSGVEHHNLLKGNQKNFMAIGAGNTDKEALSPIRKFPSKCRRQRNNDGDEGSNAGSDDESSSNNNSDSPSESINMIDDLMEEIGEMDLERATILKEINRGTENESQDICASANSTANISMPSNGKSDPGVDRDFEEKHIEIEADKEAEPPKPLKSLNNSWDCAERTKVNVSDVTNDSEVLDETLHLLNNLKDMLTSHEGNEHETTVLERLEVLSELMQSQDQSSNILRTARPNLSTRIDHNLSSDSAGDAASISISPSLCNANDSSGVSVAKIAAPWVALVAELRNRCEFLEQDRDEVTRITEQILERERATHKAELEAAIATAERKAKEALRSYQLESNQDVEDFYQSVCFQCQHEAFDYSKFRK